MFVIEVGPVTGDPLDVLMGFSQVHQLRDSVRAQLQVWSFISPHSLCSSPPSAFHYSCPLGLLKHPHQNVHLGLILL